MQKKIHGEQNINIFNKDRFSITDFFFCLSSNAAGTDPNFNFLCCEPFTSH